MRETYGRNGRTWLDSYLGETERNFPILGPEEQKRLIERIRSESGETAKNLTDILVLSNQKIVAKIAFKYARRGVDVIDLFQEGNTGLMRAIQKYDISRGASFATYAYASIENAIKNHLAQNGRAPRCVSIDCGDFPIPSPESDLNGWRESYDISQNVIKYLKERGAEDRDIEIFSRRYGIGCHARQSTLREIGKEFGLTKQAVKNVCEKMLKLLADKEDNE